MTYEAKPFYFNSCCFCISLRLGCFLMAYTQLIGLSIGIVASAVLVNMAIDRANERFQYIPSLWFLIGGVIFFFMALTLLFVIIVLVGLHKKKPGLIKAYLVYNVILLMIFAGLIVTAIATKKSSYPVLITRIFQLIGSIYYLLVYRNYYVDLKGGSDQTLNSQG